MTSRTILLCLFCCMQAFASADLAAGEQALNKDDYGAALNEFLPLAKQGNPRAQLHLGYMYAQGQGVPLDYKAAVKWIRLAADQGNSDAELTLGNMHHNGLGVPRDDKEAVKWYRLAADQGDSQAQLSLGAMAAASGDAKGAKNRDLLAWAKSLAEELATPIVAFLYLLL